MAALPTSQHQRQPASCMLPPCPAALCTERGPALRVLKRDCRHPQGCSQNVPTTFLLSTFFLSAILASSQKPTEGALDADLPG
mmetsp:Transcript_44104/g.111171  ORF Transcript_44104/g.111171 Transcript_44104/m.111171 type:complete len:83 (-) Transcript_44104:31-279(-)